MKSIFNELSNPYFSKGLAMKYSVLIVSMIAALGLTACAEEVEEPIATGESEVLGEEASGGMLEGEEAERRGGIVREGD